ncbi:hypothetical protein KUTeg_022896 [Tegillarca granosa]|uniref:Oxysterol-binding protein n=1 Tax=Tegillarca granosa TaxID=220873 RepID=A0ABQ9E034_TEGGR|nr:hypothetical protein KUTeg_022896 [Tegillarca granosa]
MNLFKTLKEQMSYPKHEPGYLLSVSVSKHEPRYLLLVSVSKKKPGYLLSVSVSKHESGYLLSVQKCYLISTAQSILFAVKGMEYEHNKYKKMSSESKLFMPVSDKSQPGNTVVNSASKMSKRESLKVQKKNYRSQKKQAARELLSTLKDPSVIVLADWLKVRGTLKSWTKIWCVLKPGLLVLYKSQKQKGPKGETIGAIVQPLPYSYVIFRSPSESAGKCWMDALELALRCTGLLMRSMKKDQEYVKDEGAPEIPENMLTPTFHLIDQHDQLNESDCEKHFEDQGLDEDSKTDREEMKTDTESDTEYEEEKVFDEPPKKPEETHYAENMVEELGQQGDSCQTEEVNDENKGLIWMLVKQGLKKPYNPIIGETFRCNWYHPKTKSRTYYIAEQISHHPPVSAFHVTNRQDGFNISGSILAKSKFYGNSLSALLDGTAKLTFLKRGEDYFITMPYAHCKGILIGTLTMEMGGKVSIDCPRTGYRCDLEFKLKPFLGSGEASNKIVGKLKMGTDTLATFEGHWDQEIYIKDKLTGETHLFWNPTNEVKAQRLKRYTVPVDEQDYGERLVKL